MPYTAENYKTLAVYKFRTYNNCESLDVEKDYSDLGVYKVTPIHHITWQIERETPLTPDEINALVKEDLGKHINNWEYDVNDAETYNNGEEVEGSISCRGVAWAWSDYETDSEHIALLRVDEMYKGGVSIDDVDIAWGW